MDTQIFARELREIFPGRQNVALRARLRYAAAVGGAESVKALLQTIAVSGTHRPAVERAIAWAEGTTIVVTSDEYCADDAYEFISEDEFHAYCDARGWERPTHRVWVPLGEYVGPYRDLTGKMRTR